MDSNNGGQPLSPEERQQQTAEAIARRKVEEAYDWRKYHSAWQDYYQKYYSNYYAKAAREYLEKNLPASATSQITASQPAATSTNPASPSSPTATPNASASFYGGTPAAITSPDTSETVSLSLKETIRKKASESFHLSQKRKKLLPLFAGIAAILIVLFLQYNRLIFAPIMAYVSPGNVKDTGLQAIDPTVTEAPGPDPRLIIPKLNIDVPVAFGISNDSATVMDAMNNGVAHFMVPGASAFPGEIGNTVITGHSAGDVYSSNQYKFIFSGLERLENGDLIYIHYNSVRYTYSVTKKDVVEPTDVQALVYETDKPMLTLITCTPLGTSRYRLLVTAEQINPSTGTEPAASPDPENPDDSETPEEAIMPANEDSFLDGLWKWLTGQD